MKDTKIEWCDHSWSPWRGCTKVSPGCANCYAETLSHRNPAVLGQWGKGKPRVKAKNWNEPKTWNRKAERAYLAAAHSTPAGTPIQFTKPTVFPSLCDIFDDEVPVDWLAEYLDLMFETPYLLWLVLTKRPENFKQRLAEVLAEKLSGPKWGAWDFVDGWLLGEAVPANVWIGTSVEDQIRADERIPALLRIPARGRFLSLEPLLGPVDLFDALTPHRMLDWLIIGGESGNGSRPCNVEWIRSLVAQGKAAGVPTFVKQLGARPEIEAPSGSWMQPVPVKNKKGGDPAEWPADLRVREFPQWGR